MLNNMWFDVLILDNNKININIISHNKATPCPFLHVGVAHLVVDGITVIKVAYSIDQHTTTAS